MNSLLTTIIERPYVFAFLIAYLVLAVRRWGWTKTVIWLISGYFIAWISEYSSIHNGFPYGEYHYIYENLKGELLIAGVPFFDSLSYPFLIFAGYTTGEYILNPPCPPLEKGGWGGFLKVIILGTLLTMLLDIIIDPIATMGNKWFLGKIHYYAHPGWYFGVPLTNFLGWFLVPLVVIVFNTLVWRANPPCLPAGCVEVPPLKKGGNFVSPPLPKGGWGGFDIIYPLFYLSIALFNATVTFWVGEWKLGLVDSAIISIIAFAVMRAFLNVHCRQTK